MERSYFEIDGVVLLKYTGEEAGVTVPSGIKTVASSAFRDAKAHEIILPEGVEYICRGAFYNCHELERVELPESLRVIEPYAFKGCWHLKEIRFPENVERVEEFAFESCEGLRSVTLPTHAALERGLFAQCLSLQTVTFPAGLQKIPRDCFRGCRSLESITLPEGVESIGEYAFEQCLGLKELVLPASMTDIERSAFEECSALTSVTLSEGLTRIAEKAFEKCTALAEIAIPESVTEIGHSAFSACRALVRVSLPRRAMSINAYAFDNTPFAPPADWFGGYTEAEYIDGHLITAPKSIYHKAFTVKEGTEFIDEQAFRGRDACLAVHLPESVREIGAHTFAECSMLAEINLPGALSLIGEGAFSGCTALKKIILPEGLTEIGARAFANCRLLRSVRVPKGATVAPDAFEGAALPLGFCRFDEKMNVPFSEIPEEKRTCYRFAVEGPDTMDDQLLGLDRFALTPCTEEEWGMLMDACNEWKIVYEYVDDFDPGDECGYAEPDRTVITEHYDLYPENCLVRDGKVIGFTVKGKRLLIGRLESFYCKFPTNDDRYTKYETYTLKRRPH